MIGLGCRELADELKCSLSTANKALRELDDSGLAQPMTGGHWKGKRATEWRLTFFPCHKTGELPILNWERRPVFATENTKDRVGIHNAPNCSSGETQKPKNSISESLKCSSGSTHIDIYQEGTASSTVTEPAPWETSSEGEGEVPNNFGSLETQKFDDPRIVSLRNWGAGSQLKPWTKPRIISDERRDLSEFPADDMAA
jgi:hypothetical protein